MQKTFKPIIFLILISFIAFSGCEETGKQAKNTSEKETEGGTNEPSTAETFEKFLATMPIAKLPLSAHCAASYPEAKKGNTAWVAQFAQEGEELYKRIPAPGDLEIFMTIAPADIPLPVIYTYSPKGNLISRKPLFEKYCGGEPGLFQSEFFLIQTNGTVILRDSTWTYDVDEMGMNIESTEELKVEESSFSLVEQL